MSTVEHHRVVIVGAGIAGVGLGVRLLQAGIDDFVLLERNASVGGTWFEHTYPGCGCDIPAHLYSYSFARNPRWSRTFPRQDEILDYVRRTADEHGVTPHVRFETEMEHSRWDQAANLWRIRTDASELTADLLISAIGATAEPAEPEIEGLASFTGHRFHSARWDHDHDLAGERAGGGSRRLSVGATGFAGRVLAQDEAQGTAGTQGGAQEPGSWIVRSRVCDGGVRGPLGGGLSRSPRSGCSADQRA